ncbi:MAG: glycosyltransferase [Bacteroidaceae bacterium]|nr:glycosyltransferase [Bacteroidaceae bacterium]
MVDPYVYLIFAMLVSAATAMILIPWLIYLCHKNKLYDQPDERKLHKNNIPRMGGIAFVPATLMGITTTFAFMLERGGLVENIHTSTLLISIGVALIYFIGLIDDMFGLSANLKFIVQLIASLAFPLSGLYFNHLYGFLGIYEIPLWIGYALTIFVTLLVVNSINLIDGIDGLASGISFIALAVYCLLFYQQGHLVYCIFACSLMGALLVFMYYNILGSEKKKKKTFMGDSGSLFLGFSLCYLGIKYAMDNPNVMEARPDGILAAYTVLIIPTFDLIRVAIARKLRGGDMFEADKTHIHHKLLKSGRSATLTLITIIGMDLLFIALNFTLFYVGLPLTWIVLIDIVLFTLWQMNITRLMDIHEKGLLASSDIQERYEQHAASAKKICILAPRFPLPENGGDVLRINNIARQLRKQGYRLVLVSFHDDESPQMYEAQRIYHKIYTIPRSKVKSLLHAMLFMLSGRPMQCGYYYSSDFKKLLRKVIATEKPDLYLSHLLRMTPYLEELHLEEQSVIEMTDALSKTYAMSSVAKGEGFIRTVYGFEHHLIKKYECHVIERFPKCVLVSQADIDYLKTITTQHTPLELHANGVGCLKKLPTHYDNKKICFVGNMRTLQNQDAVLFFVNEIFPRILKHEPDTIFYIVGAQPPKAIQQLACNNIIVTGFVDDLGETISDACLTVAPVRVASGIQNKVLVAMGYGLPVVLTSLIAQGIPELVNEESALIRDDAATIAEACLRIMHDPKLRQKLSEEGHQTVIYHYSWKEKIKGYIV